MSIFVKKNGENVLPPSFYIKILAFWGLITLSAVVMQPFHAIFSQTMLQIRTDFIEKIEEVTGMKVRYSSIRPAFWGSFDIRNLSFIKGEELFFSVSRIQVKFSMAELLFNRKIFVNTVQIDRPLLQIDTDRDRDILNLFSSGEAGSLDQIMEFLPQQADYQIRRGTFQITDGKTIYLADDFNLNVLENEGEIFLDGRVAVEIKSTGLSDTAIIIKTDVSINGLYDAFHKGSVNFDFSGIACSTQNNIRRNTSFFWPVVSTSAAPQLLFTINPFNITVSYENRMFAVNQDGYYFNYDTKTGNVSAGINLNRFRPNEKVIFSDPSSGINHFLSMQITGNSSFRYEDGIMDYRADFRGENRPATDTFIINVSGNKETIFVRDLFLSSAKNTAANSSFQGGLRFLGSIGLAPFKPEGTFVFDRFSLTAKESLSAVLNVTNQGTGTKISSGEIDIAGTQLKNLDILIYPENRYIGLTASVFSENNGRLYIDAVLERDSDQLEASVSFASFSVFDITEVLRPFMDFIDISFIGRGNLQDSLINADFFLTTDFNNIVYNAPNIEFNFGRINANLSLSGTDRQITLSEGIFSANENEFLASANMNFSNPMDLVFTVNASYLNLSWNLEGHILDRTTLIIHEPNGLYVYGNVSNSGAMSGYIEGLDFPVPLNSRTAYLNFYSALRYNSADFWNLDINHFTVREVNAQVNGQVNGAGDLFRFSGAADQDGAYLRDILYTDSLGTLAGSANFSWDTDFSYIEFLVNIADGYLGREYYYLEGSYKNEQIILNASVYDVQLNRFTGRNEKMLASADISVIWNSINSFNAHVDMSSFYTSIQNEVVYGSAVLNFSNDELLLNNLRLDYSGLRAILPELRLNRAEGIAKASLNVAGNIQARRLEGNIEVDISFDHVNSWLDIRQAVRSFNGTLLTENIQFADFQHDEAVFFFSANNGAFSVSGGVRNMLRIELAPDGNFFAGLSAPLPIQGTFMGTFKKGIMDVYCNNFYIDLQVLYTLIIQDNPFHIVGGYITGEMNLKGPLWNPEFYGWGRALSMRFQVPDYLGADIRPVPFELLAEGYYITFGPVVTNVGGGSGNSSGWFQFSNWVPVNIGLEILIPRGTPVPYDFNLSGFTANGEASGSINMLVDNINKTLDITANIFTNQAELGLAMENISGNFNTEESFSDLVMHSFADLTITTGSSVEFIWPSANPIIRVTPEMGTVFTLSLDTQSRQFSMNSDVRIRSGELYYLDRNFYIRQGNIVFRENETSFDPRLSVRAEIRDRSETGPVTISMIVENQPLLSFEPRFESSPGLTQLEIFSILGQNFNVAQGNENPDMAQRLFLSSTADILTQVVAGSDILTQFMFFRQFERQMRNLFRLDMFSLRTKFIQQAVISGATGFGPAAADRTYGVGNYFDNSTVFMGKYIGRDIFLHGMLTLRYDEDRTSYGGLILEPDIGIEFFTPFVNIRWDFFLHHPEDRWVSNNSVTLSWSKSF